MSDNYAATVLYKADIERELYNRATGVDAEDYILVDSLCVELSRCLGVDCSSFQDLRSAILCKAIIICPTLPYSLWNNILSVYGDSDTHDI